MCLEPRAGLLYCSLGEPRSCDGYRNCLLKSDDSNAFESVRHCAVRLLVYQNGRITNGKAGKRTLSSGGRDLGDGCGRAV